MDALPYTYSIKGQYWFFRYRDKQISLGSDFGSERFMRQYEAVRNEIVGIDPEASRIVYFIGWEGGPVKIGLADNTQGRLRTLQVGCPYELRVLAAAAGGLKREKAYHAQFAARRLRGEWFERCPEIEAEIERLKAQD